MFYIFVEAQTPTPEAPLLLWLEGGPGCSGALPFLVEQGPYRLAGLNVSTGAGGDTLVRRRRYSWDAAFHLLYVDQPLGTGFSYSSDPRDKAHNERDVSRDLLDFLHQFYAARPALANAPLFLGGESYAGHYIPPLAAAILRANAHGAAPPPPPQQRIRLQGIAVGNGYFDPGVQYSSMADYAYDNGLISAQLRDNINLFTPLCRGAARLCGLSRWDWVCKATAWACDALSFQRLTRALPNINWADIRITCAPGSRPPGVPCFYNFSAVGRYWNRPDVQAEVGVPASANITWVGCKDAEMSADFLADIGRSFSWMLPRLMDAGVRVLLYHGDKDIVCNWMGAERMLDGMRWARAAEWRDVVPVNLTVAGAAAGTVRQLGPLAFARLYEAGHIAVMDQPGAVMAIMRRFAADRPLAAAVTEPEEQGELP
ncbi:hypothetical protein HYH02_006465 [Chlamydomonas schloesseri]|uniref:Carboxypeptidase n=1 Tax=Chlamydomonas schloesseri TaxID=2026947 RepID=A0A835WJ08_9CHLO|nr:hypothetical protein HYH02_006465 [Chlamydomonas schloesseri]|eukprot:KAG2448574.1 hypothetical protein HYH02_006465 [Chlamydomonas schloesseri]